MFYSGFKKKTKIESRRSFFNPFVSSPLLLRKRKKEPAATAVLDLGFKELAVKVYMGRTSPDSSNSKFIIV